jgi:hypothetical protein
VTVLLVQPGQLPPSNYVRTLAHARVPCPELDRHTPHPAEPDQHQVWRRRMRAAGYVILRCPGCGRFAVWVPRGRRRGLTPRA